MAHEPTCQHCGAALQQGTYFCSECGKAVPAANDRPAPKGTMLGGAGPSPPKSPPAAVSAADDAGRTTAAGLAQPPRGQMGRTMLGIPLSPSPPPPESSPAAAPDGAKRPMGRTMIGLPAAVAPPRPERDDAAAGAGPQAAGLSDPRHARTLVGMPEAGADEGPMQPVARDADVAAAPRAQPADAQRTMLGLGEDAAPVDEGPAGGEPSSDSPRRGGEPSDRGSSARGSRPSGATGRASARGSVPGVRRGPSKPVLAVAVLALAAAAVLGYLALRPAPGPGVRVRVVSEGDSESMLFEVPGAASGTKLRFGGQEKPLEAGRAGFPLAPDSLRVGKNVVPYDLVKPSGEITSGRVTLSVDYRVMLDTAKLHAGQAAVEVVVSALPGSQVWLDGERVELDAQGRAVRSDTLEPRGTSDRIEHVVRYRVQPQAGETSMGELRTSIPVTLMAIDKPGMQLTTDRDSVEIAGAVDKDARVAIDGEQVDVNDGRFLHRYPLPEPGAYHPEVMASSAGKAPRAMKLSVTRVHDLAEAAKDFAPDATLTYAKIAQNPAIYRGQRVEFEGRVYNVNVEGGRSALQVLVRECAAGQRCPLWVGYHAATEHTIDSWVRVLGVVEGEQQFRSETDEIKVVPKVEAAFLLPAKR